MSLEKAIDRLTQVIKAVKVDPNTTPIEYGPDGRMRPATPKFKSGQCVTRQVSVVNSQGNSERQYQCMCFYDRADGTRCIVRLTDGICGNDEGLKNIPSDMPCITS